MLDRAGKCDGCKRESTALSLAAGERSQAHFELCPSCFAQVLAADVKMFKAAYERQRLFNSGLWVMIAFLCVVILFSFL